MDFHPVHRASPSASCGFLPVIRRSISSKALSHEKQRQRPRRGPIILEGLRCSIQKELLRHADIRTTMNVYAQAISDDKREAASKVARTLYQAVPR
jgi:integrase